VGGRYQITQLYFSGHGEPAPAGGAMAASSAAPPLADSVLDNFSRLSAAGADAGPEPAGLMASKADPGVLGGLLAEPKAANAPEPRLKALAAPPVGDEMPAVVRGAMLLKGLDRPPCELSAP
jgi:hypothetical protein